MTGPVRRKDDTNSEIPRIKDDQAGARALLSLQIPFSNPEESTAPLRQRVKQARNNSAPTVAPSAAAPLSVPAATKLVAVEPRIDMVRPVPATPFTAPPPPPTFLPSLVLAPITFIEPQLSSVSDPFALMIDDKSTAEQLTVALHKATSVLLNNGTLDLDETERSLLIERSQSLVQNIRYLHANKDPDICAALFFLSCYEKAPPSSLVLVTFERLYTNLGSLPSDPNTTPRVRVLIDTLLDCLKIICIRRGNLEFSDVKTIVFNPFTFKHIGYAKSFILMGALSNRERKHEVAETYNLTKSKRSVLVNLFLSIQPKDNVEKFSIIQSLYLLAKNEYIAASEFNPLLMNHLQEYYLQEHYPPELQPCILYLQSLPSSIRRPLYDLNHKPPRSRKGTKRSGEASIG